LHITEEQYPSLFCIQIFKLREIMTMILLMQTGADVAYNTPHFPYAATATYVVGFIAAVTLGSVAWYNSKRPPGWENKERPDLVPEVELEETPGLGEPEN
jgi:hypothetical protein